MTRQLLDTIGTIDAAAKALRDAPDYWALQDAWSMHCDRYADESQEREHLLEIYHDRAAQFAVEAARFGRA